MAGEVSTSDSFKTPRLNTPFDSSDRIGKEIPRGPVDPIAVWAKAREIHGLTKPADEQQMEALKITFMSLCEQIAASNEDIVLGRQEDPNEVGRRWTWHQATLSEQGGGEGGIPTEAPSVTPPYPGSHEVALGKAGQMALGQAAPEPDSPEAA